MSGTFPPERITNARVTRYKGDGHMIGVSRRADVVRALVAPA